MFNGSCIFRRFVAGKYCAGRLCLYSGRTGKNGHFRPLKETLIWDFTESFLTLNCHALKKHRFEYIFKRPLFF